MPCSATPILSQLAHCGSYAIAAVAFASVAVTLDVLADWLYQLGASRNTTRLLQIAFLWLLGLDLLVLVAQATMSAGVQLRCLAGF